MENQIQDKYRSKDFYLSSVVLATGISLLKLEKDGKDFVFIFDSSVDNANKVIREHWDYKLVLPTRKLIEAINELKTRVHSGI